MKYKSKFFFFFITGVLSIIFQIKVFGLIVYYAKYFSSGEIISFFGLQFLLESPMGAFAFKFSNSSISFFVFFLCLYVKKILFRYGAPI